MVPIGGGLARGDGPLAKDSLPPVSLLVVFVLLLLFFPLFFFFFLFFLLDRDRQETDRQAGRATGHTVCVSGEAARRLTAAMLRECRGLEVV